MPWVKLFYNRNFETVCYGANRMFQPNRVHQPLIPEIAAVSVKNSFHDKPNEDAFIRADPERIFIVADGVSRLRDSDNRYPNPSPSVAAARLLVETGFRFLRERTMNGGELCATDLANALHRANEAIARYNVVDLPRIEPESSDPAGAVGLIAHLNGEILSYAYLGDVELRHVRGETVRLITVNQTTAIENLLRLNNRGPSLEPMIRRSIRNNPEHPNGWGVLTGEDSALHFIRGGELHLARGDRVIISTDGLLHALNSDEDLVRRGTPEQIIEAMLAIEAQGEVRSDDKTLITVDLH